MEKEQAGQMSSVGKGSIASYFRGLNIGYILGCIAMVVAAFMPYIRDTEKKMSLMDGNDGIFFLGFTVLVFIFVFFERGKVVTVLSAVLVYLGAYELVHTYGVMSKTGKVITLQAGYYVMLAGTVLLLGMVICYVYRNWMKDMLGRLFDRFFPEKKEED